MTVRTKACVCSRSVAATEGSNTPEGMDVFLLCLLCVVQYISRRTDHSFREVLPSVGVCLGVD